MKSSNPGAGRRSQVQRFEAAVTPDSEEVIAAIEKHEAANPSAVRYVPVPSSSITCGFEEALSMMEMVPCCAPCFVGENFALIVQFAPGATLWPQVDFMTNWALAFIDCIFNSVMPVLVRVTVCAVLVVPTVWLPKFGGVVGEKLTVPVLSSVMTLRPSESTTARSGLPSPLKSAAAM